MVDDVVTLPGVLREHLDRRSMTIHEWAAANGISVSRAVALYCGATVRGLTMTALAKALDCSVARLDVTQSYDVRLARRHVARFLREGMPPSFAKVRDRAVYAQASYEWKVAAAAAMGEKRRELQWWEVER